MKFAAFLLFALVAATSLRAEEVVIEHQGLDVLGNLELAQGKSLKADGAMLIVHDTLAHHRMEIIAAQQELLRERGINTLAITLSLGLNQRRGMFDCAIEQDHRHDDAVEEIDTWVQWLKEKGVGKIVLAGHGRGAAQVALYAERKQDKAIKKLVLIAPLMQTFESAEREYQLRFRKSLRETLGRAEELISQDRGDELLEGASFLECQDPKVTAGAFADYYSASPRFVTTNLLVNVKVPALIITGDQDAAEAGFASTTGAAPKTGAVTVERVPGADRYFSDLFADQLADRIKAFLAK